MGVGIELVNHDEIYRLRNSIDHVIINDLPQIIAADRQRVTDLIMTRYSPDAMLTNIPSCECKTLTGMYHSIGTICMVCHKPVEYPTDQELQPRVWMRAPAGVRSLVNPTFWSHLTDLFKVGSYYIIHYLCDPTYSPKIRPPKVLEAVKQLNIPRGFNHFLDHFDAILEQLLTIKEFAKKAKRVHELKEEIRLYRHCLFPQFLALPNRSMIILEDSNVGPYFDTTLIDSVDAIHTIAGIDTPYSNLSLYHKEQRALKAIIMLAKFHSNWVQHSLSSKTGVARKHLFGTRTDFSFRAVISSRWEPHDYEELVISWGIGITVLRLHLMNKLFKLGYNPDNAASFLDAHATRYHPLLANLFKELIAQSPYKGIPITINRNPSLERG